MGMFDSVMVPCPKCNKKVEFQSKAGECALFVYTLENAPTEIIFDIMNHPHYCKSCDSWFALVDPNFPPNQSLPRPNLRVEPVKTPSDASIHQSQPYMRWWPFERNFTYDDLENPLNEKNENVSDDS